MRDLVTSYQVRSKSQETNVSRRRSTSQLMRKRISELTNQIETNLGFNLIKNQYNFENLIIGNLISTSGWQVLYSNLLFTSNPIIIFKF